MSTTATRTVPDLILERAQGDPAAPAVLYGSRSVTYGELDSRIRELSEMIRAESARGEVVAVEGPAGPELVVAAAAVMAAGRVLLLVDARLPPTRRERLLAEARSTVTLASAGEPTLVRRPAALEPHEVPGDAAYVFFTSGTTGTPSAVLGRSGALAHFLQWETAHVDLRPGDRCAMLTGLAFDVVLRDMFAPLIAGAILVIPEGEGPGPDDVCGWLVAERIHLLHAVPTLTAEWLAGFDRPAAHSPATVLFAGEPLTDALVTRWRSCFPDTRRIVNLYGPTETTLATCAFDVPDPPREAVQPLGTPLPGASILVLDDAGRLLPDGRSGQLAIQTPYRSAGYLNAPDETRRRFVAPPGGAASDEPVFLTGDRGRRGADGLLRYEGRLDAQLKIRGVRVEPGEVEAALRDHPEVRDAAVIGTAIGSPSARLVAFVVARGDDTPRAEELRAHVAHQLPASLVPAAFTAVDRLPTTPNGKLDRGRLQVMAQAPPAGGGGQGVRERRLHEIWCEVLGVDVIDDDDDFFVLGGHSLTAARMLSRVRRDFGLDVPLGTLFDAPTLGGFAAAMDDMSRPGGRLG